jgi:hypothetical protein
MNNPDVFRTPASGPAERVRIMFKGLQDSCLRALPLAGLIAVMSFSLVSIRAAAQSGASAFTTIDASGAGTGMYQGTAVTAIDTAGDVVGIYLNASNAIHGFVLPAGRTITTFDVTGAGTRASQGTIPTCIKGSGVIAGALIDYRHKFRESRLCARHERHDYTFRRSWGAYYNITARNLGKPITRERKSDDVSLRDMDHWLSNLGTAERCSKWTALQLMPCSKPRKAHASCSLAS